MGMGGSGRGRGGVGGGSGKGSRGEKIGEEWKEGGVYPGKVKEHILGKRLEDKRMGATEEEHEEEGEEEQAEEENRGGRPPAKILEKKRVMSKKKNGKGEMINKNNFEGERESQKVDKKEKKVSLDYLERKKRRTAIAKVTLKA